MKFLLTSAGIKNPEIDQALVDLLDKPIAESSALCISTSSYGHPMAGPPCPRPGVSSVEKNPKPRWSNWVGSLSACWN